MSRWWAWKEPSICGWATPRKCSTWWSSASLPRSTYPSRGSGTARWRPRTPPPMPTARPRPSRTCPTASDRQPALRGLLRGLLPWQEDLLEQQLEGGGDGDREQRANDAEQAGADERRDHDHRSGDVDGARHHPGIDHVVLELLVDDVEDQAEQPDLRVGREPDRGHDHGAERRADHRDHVEQRDDCRERHGVLPEADDEQEDQGADTCAHRDDERAGDVRADVGEDLVAEVRHALATA